MAEELVCSSCGRAFTLDAGLAERYPGWSPRDCPSCYAAQRAGGGADGRSGPGRGRRPPAAPEENLTVAQVLDRYASGPDSGVFTDGSANPNPGPGGWGAVYVVDGEVVDRAHGHEPRTTNNRMELTAVLRGMELVPDGTPAVIWSDSKLVVDTLNDWAAGWERRGWKRRTGVVTNLDLVRPTFERFRARPELELRWIKAHAGSRWNEYADSLSTAWSRAEV